MRDVAAAEIFANFCIRQPPHFPGAIGVLEARSTETLPGEIPEDEIALGDGRVFAQIPGLANREIAEQILGGIRLKRNRDYVAEQFRYLREMRIHPPEEQEMEFGELPEQGQ